MTDPAAAQAVANIPPLLRYQPSADVGRAAGTLNTQMTNAVAGVQNAKHISAKDVTTKYIFPVLASMSQFIEMLHSDVVTHFTAAIAHVLHEQQPQIVLGVHPDDVEAWTEGLGEVADYLASREDDEKAKEALGVLQEVIAAIQDAEIDEDALGEQVPEQQAFDFQDVTEAEPPAQDENNADDIIGG